MQSLRKMAFVSGEQFNCEEQNKLELATCNICFEAFNKIRKLPCCSHRFCEKCLVRFVAELKLKPKAEDVEGDVPGKAGGIHVECPVCREKHPGPRADQDATEWVQTLEAETVGFETVQDRQDKMEETHEDICAGCKESNRDSKAERFCYECREYFCKNCCDFIHRVKTFKDHPLLKLDAEAGLGTEHAQRDIKEMLVKFMTCGRHPDKSVTFICRDDGRLCCVSCAIEESSKGKCVQELTKFATKEDNDTKADELINKFEKLATLSEIIITKKNETESIEKEETNIVIDKIRSMRLHVNNLFDSLEANVLQQCRAATKEHKIAAMEDVDMIRETMKNIDCAQTLLRKSKQEDSVKVAYAVNYYLEKTLNCIKATVLEMKTNCKQYGCELKVKEVLEQFLEVGVNNSVNLAVVTGKVCPASFPDCLDKNEVENRPIFALKNGNVILEGRGDIAIYTGVVYLPDSRIIVVDNGKNNTCSLIRGVEMLASCDIEKNAGVEQAFITYVMKDGTGYTEFNEYAPIGAAYLHNDLIAVSVSGTKKINFLTTKESLRIRYQLHTQLRPFALVGLKNGDLAVAWKDLWSFSLMSLSRNGVYEEKLHLEHDKNGRQFKTFRFLAVDENRLRIVQPCIVDQAVYCFDFQGNPVFSYTDDRLVFPQGVAVDSHGNIFVCDSKTSCIHVLSQTGNGMQILFEGDQLYWPIAIAFNHDSSECIVTHGGMSNHLISIYQLKYEHE